MAEPGFPSHSDYVLARRCPTCGALPDVDCDTPRKHASQRRIDETRTQLGWPPVPVDRVKLQHAARIDAGIAHYRSDLSKAPWPEDREPGKNYGTIQEGA
jgi:hypothetical protein